MNTFFAGGLLVVDDNATAAGLAHALEPYLELLTTFADGRSDAPEFQRRFMSKYLNDSTTYPDDVFLIFDRYFSEVESYVADPALRDPSHGDVDAETLRAATEALLHQARVR